MISHIELQGQITRSQDFTTIKHNEENKGMVDQVNYQQVFEENVETKVRQVRQGDRSENEGKRPDAKEEGNGRYSGDGGRRRKKKEEDGRVVLKGHNSFDMKI